MDPNDKYHYDVWTPANPSPYRDCIDADGCAVIPENVGVIGDMAFYGCSELKAVVLHAGVATIHPRAFLACPNLAEFRVADESRFFLAVDGVLFSWQGALVRCPPARSGRYAIPDGIVEILGGAFRQCELLTEVTFPESLRNIREYAFADCTGLTAVAFPVFTVILCRGRENYGLFVLFSCMASALAIFQHRGNIKRLLRGEENRLDFGKITKVSEKVMQKMREKK